MLTLSDGILVGMVVVLVITLVVVLTTNWKLDRATKEHDRLFERYQEIIRRERNE